MTFLDQYIIFPIMTLILIGFLFIHIGLRSWASLIALLCIAFVIAWQNIAHWAVHEYFMPPGDDSFERMGQFSAHPVFDSIQAVLVIGAVLAFFGAFFISAIAISTRRFATSVPPSEPRVVASMGTRTLWLVVGASVVIAIAASLRYRHLLAVAPLDLGGVLTSIAALSGIVCSMLFSAVAIRRSMIRDVEKV